MPDSVPTSESRELDDRAITLRGPVSGVFAESVDWGRGLLFAWAAAIVLIVVRLQADIPVREFLEGGDIERLYRMSAVSSWRHLLYPEDYHHPGLWAALVRWPFLLSGHSLGVPAFFGRLCAILCIPIAGWLTASYAGRLAAGAVMLNIAFFPMLAIQSWDFSDTTLFVLLGLIVLLSYERIRQAPTRGWKTTFGIAFALSFHASYAAPVLAAALSADLWMNRQQWERVRRPFLMALFVGLPRLLHLVLLLPTEVSLEQEARQYPMHWASVGFLPFLATSLHEFFTEEWPSLAPFAFAAVLLGRRLLPARRVLVFGLLAYGCFLCLHEVFRIRDYNAIFLPVLSIVFIATLMAPGMEGESWLHTVARRFAALATSLSCSMLFIVHGAEQRPQWMERESRPDESRGPVQTAIHAGAHLLVVDGAWQHATWNFLSDRWGTMDRCYRGELRCFGKEGYHDDDSNRTVIELGGRVFSDEWRAQSIPEVKALQREASVYVLINRALPHPEFYDFLGGECTTLDRSRGYELWLCPQRARS